MSAASEQWAWELVDSRLTLAEKTVLVYMARRAYYDDGCGAWPAIDTIARHCNCTRRSVIRCLKRLQELGYLCEGDQMLSARNPRSHEPIPKGHRTKVWDVVMKGANTKPENITEHKDTPTTRTDKNARRVDAPHASPVTQAAVSERVKVETVPHESDVRGDIVSGDTMSPQGTGGGEVTSCPIRGDTVSPNRQVINSYSPLSPSGTFPQTGKPHEKNHSDQPTPDRQTTNIDDDCYTDWIDGSKELAEMASQAESHLTEVDWRLAAPPKGVRDPLWQPDPATVPEPLRCVPARRFACWKPSANTSLPSNARQHSRQRCATGSPSTGCSWIGRYTKCFRCSTGRTRTRNGSRGLWTARPLPDASPSWQSTGESGPLPQPTPSKRHSQSPNESTKCNI